MPFTVPKDTQGCLKKSYSPSSKLVSLSGKTGIGFVS